AVRRRKRSAAPECDGGSVAEPERDPRRARLVGQVAHPGAPAPLPIERQEGALVGQVAAEDRELPTLARHTDAHVDEIVGRQEWVERERGLRQRSTDRLGPEGGQVDGAVPWSLVVDQRVARAYVLIAGADERPRPCAHRPPIGDGR